jgi:hypothetical protein
LETSALLFVGENGFFFKYWKNIGDVVFNEDFCDMKHVYVISKCECALEMYIIFAQLLTKEHSIRENGTGHVKMSQVTFL